MIPFLGIELSDRPWIEALLRHEQIPLEEYSFSFSFIWRRAYKLKVARMNDYFLLMADRPDNVSYLFPTGQGDLKPVLDALLDDAHARGVKLHFHCLTAEQRAAVESLYPGRFSFTAIPEFADYYYDTESLTTLAGKKLHSKRNHINRFMENNPDWSYAPIGPDNLEACREMNEIWCQQEDCDDDDDLKVEACAVRQALTHFEELGFSGGVLMVGERIVAFTIGDRLTDEVFMVHIEKAFAQVQGAYPMINQLFVQHSCQGYPLINRQDDMGVEGLRRAKQSYQPVRIADKFRAQEQ